MCLTAGVPLSKTVGSKARLANGDITVNCIETTKWGGLRATVIQRPWLQGVRWWGEKQVVAVMAERVGFRMQTSVDAGADWLSGDISSI